VRSFTAAIAACLGLIGSASLANAALGVTVVQTWSRPAVDTAVVYGVVRNAGSHRVAVMGASSPVARSAELHESMTMKAGAMDGAAMSAMEMRPAGTLTVPAHGALTLKPGGYHVMLMGLRRPLAPGQRFPLTLRFGDGSHLTVEVPVENRAF
jgi:periplasmic copper chaperone A